MINNQKLNSVQQYPAEILSLLTTSGFIAEFYQQCMHHKTDMEAFEYVNTLHEKYFLKPKYRDWDSFKTIRKRFIRTLKSK